MKRYFKTVVFVVLVVLGALYWGAISKDIKQDYNYCIGLMANAMPSINYVGF